MLGCFLTEPIDVSELPVFLITSLRYMKQKHNSVNSAILSCSFAAKVPKQCAFFSVPLAVFMFIFILCVRFLPVLSRRNREKGLYSIFLSVCPKVARISGLLIYNVNLPNSQSYINLGIQW